MGADRPGDADMPPDDGPDRRDDQGSSGEHAGQQGNVQAETRTRQEYYAALRVTVSREESTVARQATAEEPDASQKWQGKVAESRVWTDIERLKGEGFRLNKLKNSWSDEEYKGINSQWIEPETGQRFEVQFHTRISFEVKQLTHDAYKRLRSQQADEFEKMVLKAFQRKVYPGLDFQHPRVGERFPSASRSCVVQRKAGSPAPAVTFARLIPVLRLIGGTGIPPINRRTPINRDFGKRETGVTPGMHTGAGRRPVPGTVATTP